MTKKYYRKVYKDVKALLLSIAYNGMVFLVKVMIERYIKAYEQHFETVKKELKNGKKESHWMWYIFPQIEGLGHSEMSQKYAIKNIAEAREFLLNDYLREKIIELCEIILAQDDDINVIFEYPDNKKLQSSMTLFSLVSPTIDIFGKVLDKFYEGERDTYTVDKLVIKL